MERITDIERAKDIMGKNFIGLTELISIKDKMGIYISDKIIKSVPKLTLPLDFLEKYINDYILILAIPFYKNGSKLTVVKMKEHFSCDPEKLEPCFYNQDWYLKEKFANEETLKSKWYLVKKDVFEVYRGIDPKTFPFKENKLFKLPTAILCAYTFFANYFISNGEILWKNDFVWCSDSDSNNDQIYIGRYIDPKKINKNGFNIHRHLSINKSFSCISVL